MSYSKVWSVFPSRDAVPVSPNSNLPFQLDLVKSVNGTAIGLEDKLFIQLTANEVTRYKNLNRSYASIGLDGAGQYPLTTAVTLTPSKSLLAGFQAKWESNPEGETPSEMLANWYKKKKLKMTAHTDALDLMYSRDIFEVEDRAGAITYWIPFDLAEFRSITSLLLTDADDPADGLTQEELANDEFGTFILEVGPNLGLPKRGDSVSAITVGVNATEVSLIDANGNRALTLTLNSGQIFEFNPSNYSILSAETVYLLG